MHHPLLFSGQKVSARKPSGLSDSERGEEGAQTVALKMWLRRWRGRWDLATRLAPGGFSGEAKRVACVLTGRGAVRSPGESPAGSLRPLGDSGEELSEVPGAGLREAPHSLGSSSLQGV